MERPDIKIVWRDATPRRAARVGVLYAYLHPDDDEILYIGKADRASARERWNATDKLAGFWRDLEEQRGISEHRFIVGVPKLLTFSRLTSELLHDIEGLLIARHRPWGNIQSVRSRSITRPGLVVENVGQAWCGRARVVDR